MQEYIQEITKYACTICAEEFSSRKDIEQHLKCASEYNDGLIKEKIPDNFEIGSFIKVKHRWQKTYTMAKIVSFAHDSMLHQLVIYLDRFCHNRDSDCFPQYDTHCQCSTLEILSEEELPEYTLEQVEQ